MLPAIGKDTETSTWRISFTCLRSRSGVWVVKKQVLHVIKKKGLRVSSRESN